jgi:Immunity protein Imm5
MTSPELAEQIAVAREAIRTSPHGELPLANRRRLRAAFGPWTVGGAHRYSAGWRRRVRLAQLCAERALEHWRRDSPDDDRPQAMLRLADRVMAGEVTPAAAAQEAKASLAELNEEQDQQDKRATWAWFAAIGVAAAAGAADYGDSLPPDTTDKDLDPDALEPAYAASIAEALHPGTPGADDVRRRAYWQWYVDEAVPAAYASVPG